MVSSDICRESNRQNNYAISSDGLATALQDSASALMSAGNDLEQSVALIAAANKVVQDPNSVGSALRTISLRLRGTSVEVLEEMGEETDGVVESTSKLQKKLKALTGVDILTDSGAYKDTYTILKEIAEVWNELDDIDQAAALELMAGKNRANTLAALLTNMEDLEGAYQSALDAEGSALKENQAYLDSIQGRIDLFTNALQTAWANIIDTNFIKSIVDAGTTLVGILGNIPMLLTAMATAFAVFSKIQWYNEASMYGKWLHSVIPTVKELATVTLGLSTAQDVSTKKSLAQALAGQKVNGKMIANIISTAGLKGVTGQLSKEQIKNAQRTLAAKLATGDLTKAQYLAAMSSMGLTSALEGLGQVLISNKLLVAAAVIAAVALAFDKFHKTAHEAAEAADEAFTEIRNTLDETKSTIQSLEGELSTLRSQIEELEGKHISFVDSEELKRLKAQEEQLEHSLRIQEQLRDSQQETQNKRAVAAMKAYTKAASAGAEKTQKAWQTAGNIIGGVIGVAGIAASVIIPGDFGSIGVGGAAAGKAIAANVAKLGIKGIAKGTAKKALTTGGAAFMASGVYGGGIAGEAIGSSIAANAGTYESWYETYTKAIEAAQEEEEKALKKYQKDTSNIDKLEKWQETQERTSEIEAEMYEHLSQMQTYYNGLEYGMSDEIDAELDAWYTFLDKFNIDQGAADAKTTALDRIFGENASKEIQAIEKQILHAIKTGEDFDFEAAINGSQELNDLLTYMGITAEDVANYFTQVGEEVAKVAAAEEINSVETYSTIIESVSQYNEILTQTNEILGDNTQVTQEYKDSVVALVGSEKEVNKYFDENNDLVVKNAKGLKELVSQNIKLAKAQHQLDYYNLVKQLNNTLRSTKELDGATKESIYTLLDQIDTVELAIYQYQLLEDSLLGARNAFEEFAKAKEIDAANSYGDSYVEMVQTMYDGFYKTGQVGTEAFWAAAEALVPMDVYHHLTEDADRMKAIYDYYNKNILPSLNLDKDQLSLNYEAIEEFVDDALKAGVFEGDRKSFDLVEGMNLEKAAELLGYTQTQAYALFAELDKYNVSGSEPSFLIQLDDSLEGRIMRITSDVEELNKQKLALLEDGGYDQHQKEIDAINQELAACDASLSAVGEEAYAAWQAYADNDVVLDSLAKIEDKQQAITEEAAKALGLKWDEVSGKTVQQVYDEILIKQQELGEPTELKIELASDYVQQQLDALEQEFEEKEIDIKAHVVWNEEKEQYEVAEGSQYANDASVQEYAQLANEQYVLDNFLSGGLTATETYLSNIESILQSIYGVVSGEEPESAEPENTSETSKGAAPISNADVRKGKTSNNAAVKSNDEFWNNLGSSYSSTAQDKAAAKRDQFDSSWNSFWDNFASNFGADYQEKAAAKRAKFDSFITEDIPEWANGVGETLNKFFTETVPEAWNEFWANVGTSLDAFGDDVSEIYNIARTFFTEAVPEAWNEFWAGVSDRLTEIGNDAIALYEVVSKFFKETIPQKWNEFWSSVDSFVTENVPYAISYVAGVVARFFTTTIPEKWEEFWNEVGEFIDDTKDAAEKLYNAAKTFITETIPEKWEEFWQDVSDFYKEAIEPVIEEVKASIETFIKEFPEKWNEFWEDVGNFFSETIPNAVDKAKGAIHNFLFETIPEKWEKFWDDVAQFIEENIAPVLSLLQDKVLAFFDAVSNKWNAFWDDVNTFIFETIPTAYKEFKKKIIEFLTETLPEKWDEFWDSVDQAFVTPIQEGLASIKSSITTFFQETLPNKINAILDSIGSWISEKASSIWENLKAGFSDGYNGNSNGGGVVNGTAHARGTAYSSGSWGAPHTETALTGELGPELRVRGNRWDLLGENGAEFADVRKGDIIFNHKQTESLLKNGYVTSRGKAYAFGTAYDNGTWRPTSPNVEQSNKPGNDFSGKGQALYDAANSLNGAADSMSDAAEQSVDFIEIKLEEIEKIIAKATARIENIIDNTSNSMLKRAAYNDAIEAQKEKARTSNSAASYYSQKAASLLSAVPSQYREMAKNGAISVKDFVGEGQTKIAEAIEKYREYDSKADDAEIAALEAIAEVSALRLEMIQDIADDFDNVIGLIDSKSNLLQSNMDLVEESGVRMSEAYYDELIKGANDTIAQLEQKQAGIRGDLNAAVASGEIAVGSDDWYEAVNLILECDEAILDCKQSTEEWNNAINELKWENLDKFITELDNVDSQISHLYDLLSEDDQVVDDMGNWTDEGITSLGLLAQQMELAQYRSQQYAKAIEELEEDYAAGRYSTDEYNEKLAELTEGQWESIEAYEQAKDAIVDLNKVRVDAVKDGLQKEIDAYKKLIDAKKEALDIDKEAHDFARDVAEKQKNIAVIQRQLAAIANDNSAAANAKRKQLQAELLAANTELEELYYDKSIENQKDALDKEYEAYEQSKQDEMDALDEKLKNEEAIIQESFETIKANAQAVFETINTTANEYGVSISSAITEPWKNGENAISNYSGVFNSEIGNLNASVDSFVGKLNELLDKQNEIIESANNMANSVIDATNQSYANATESENTIVNAWDSSGSAHYDGSSGGGFGLGGSGSSSSSGSSNIQVGGKINAGNASIYENINGTPEKQYFDEDPIYNVLKEKGDWIQVRWHKATSGVTGWFKKGDVRAYAKGTLGTKQDQMAIIDELGEELVLRAGKGGRLEYLTKGSSVIPADLTKNLIEWGELDPTETLNQSRPKFGAPHITTNNFDIDLSFGSLVHVDAVSNDTLPELQKMVRKEFDGLMKGLNNSVKRYTR